MAYVVTKFSKYHSNILGDTTESSHPGLVILPSGKKVKADQDTRTDAIWNNEELSKSGKMIPLDEQVSFKILSEFDNDCDRNGSTIRWKVPKGSKLVWLKWDYENDCFGDVEKEETV